MKALHILFIAALLSPPALLAHGELHEVIAALEARLTQQPHDAATRLRLADLHRLHGERATAGRVLATLPDPKPAAFHRIHAQLAQDAGEFAAALDHARRFVKAAPDSSEAHALCARLFSQLGQWRDEADAWSEAIRLSAAPDATTYLAHATALTRSGDHPAALASVNAGIARHPREITLRERGAELLKDSGALEDARVSLRNLRALYPQLALRWWQREADWLHEAGRPEEARAASRAGLEAARTLPERQRHTAATRASIAALEARIEK